MALNLKRLSEAGKTPSKAGDRLRASVLEIGKEIEKQHRTIEQKNKQLQEDRARGSRLTKHRFSL